MAVATVTGRLVHHALRLYSLDFLSRKEKATESGPFRDESIVIVNTSLALEFNLSL